MERARDSSEQQETKSQAVVEQGGAAIEGDGGVDWDALLEDHTCPDAGDDAENDAMARKAMGGAGKKCPNPDCDMFIIKNEGCDVMMCGERAHGLLSRAIKNVRLTVLCWSLVAHFLASVHFVDGFTRVYLPSLAVSWSPTRLLTRFASRLRAFASPYTPLPTTTIMQGGCGCCYRWSTLEMTPCYITNIEGKRVSCQP